ncbi:uncharacterized protein LOC121735680 [Aricia agestis]|uniref:uncharacterized protein LOC121735680 n=1 Tax=Aricia agestis TaxID=91739 RepID=UPI001C202823|nr:uncharacterized protein LOC121735680 [Aricia agestis]
MTESVQNMIKMSTSVLIGDSSQTQKKKSTKKGKIDDTTRQSYADTKYLKVIIPKPKVHKRKITLMNWKRFHKLHVIYSFMDNLERDFPSLCSVYSIGKSVDGRDIKMLKISNSDTTNSGVWLDGGIHAREWISTAVVTYLADAMARNFSILPSSMTNKDWYIVPVLNPDGYEHSHRKDRMWRKNRARHDGHRVGVDLNRNFSFAWGNNGEEGSSESPHSVFYRGPAAFSEPESNAVRDAIFLSQARFQVFLSFHSYYELILFPWGYRREPCPHYLRLLEGGAVMARAIYETTGMIYKVGTTKDLTYEACGTSIDWSYAMAKIPYSYMIELRSKKHRFKLPNDQIEDNCKEIWNAVKSLMNFVDKNKDENINSIFLVFRHLKRQRLTIMVLPKKSQVWEIKVSKETQRHFLKQLDTEGAINIWKEDQSGMDVMIDGERSQILEAMFIERNIPYVVAINDLNNVKRREQSYNKTTKKTTSKSRMDWTSYHSLETINSFIDDLAAQYPYLCSVSSIGKSVEGRDLRVLKVSNGNSSNEGVWIDGSIHAREWISVAVVTYIVDQLVRNFHRLSDSVTCRDWYFLPVLNPDGYEYTYTHDRMWRKNRAKYGECVGVDLNRNFGHGWGEKGEDGSSDDPGSIFYRGPEPFSEPETRAVRDFILGSDTSFKVFVSFHSYGEAIIFPWGYTEDACPDYVELLEGGAALAKGIFATNGYTYKVGSTKDLMYYSAGTSVDWSYGDANILYSYMIELRSKKYKFLLPKEQILPTAEESMNGVFRLLDYIDARSSSECSLCYS